MGLRDFRGREPFGGLNSPTWAWGGTRRPPGFRAVRTGLAVLATLVGCVFAALVEDTGGANGRHTVYITAVEDTDNLFWDATLVYVKTSPQTTQEEKYCVNDPRVRKLLEEAAAQSKPVTVYYQNDFFMMKWECKGGMSIIYRVIPVTPVVEDAT